MVSQGADIAILGNIACALAEAETLPEIKTLRDKAEAARAYAKAANMGLDLQNRAAEFKLRAERKAGALLSRLSLRGGDRRSPQANRRLSLDDMGISRSQSRRWQLIASIPEEEFGLFLSRKKADAEEITLAEALRLARVKKRPKANGRAGQPFPDQPSFHNHVNTVPLETVSELQNHHKMLRQLLEPLVSDGTASLPRAQLRLTQRLLMESDTLLTQLAKQLTHLSLDESAYR